jgi:hypothetical protein
MTIFEPCGNPSSLRDGKSLELFAARTLPTAEDGRFDRPARLVRKKRKATLDDAPLSNQTEATTPGISADGQGDLMRARDPLPRRRFSPRNAAAAGKPTSSFGRLLSAGGAAALAVGGAAAVAALAGSGSRKKHGKATPGEQVEPAQQGDRSADKVDAAEPSQPHENTATQLEDGAAHLAGKAAEETRALWRGPDNLTLYIRQGRSWRTPSWTARISLPVAAPRCGRTISATCGRSCG